MQRDFPSRTTIASPLAARIYCQKIIRNYKRKCLHSNPYLDVGQHQMFTCLHYEYRYPRTQITSGGLGTMGFCLPAAMGIAIQKKDRPVISINGDADFK